MDHLIVTWFQGEQAKNHQKRVQQKWICAEHNYISIWEHKINRQRLEVSIPPGSNPGTLTGLIWSCLKNVESTATKTMESNERHLGWKTCVFSPWDPLKLTELTCKIQHIFGSGKIDSCCQMFGTILWNHPLVSQHEDLQFPIYFPIYFPGKPCISHVSHRRAVKHRKTIYLWHAYRFFFLRFVKAFSLASGFLSLDLGIWCLRRYFDSPAAVDLTQLKDCSATNIYDNETMSDYLRITGDTAGAHKTFGFEAGLGWGGVGCGNTNPTSCYATCSSFVLLHELDATLLDLHFTCTSGGVSERGSLPCFAGFFCWCVSWRLSVAVHSCSNLEISYPFHQHHGQPSVCFTTRKDPAETVGGFLATTLCVGIFGLNFGWIPPIVAEISVGRWCCGFYSQILVGQNRSATEAVVSCKNGLVQFASFLDTKCCKGYKTTFPMHFFWCHCNVKKFQFRCNATAICSKSWDGDGFVGMFFLLCVSNIFLYISLLLKPLAVRNILF